MLFVLLGILFGSWAARIPSVRDALHLSAAQLGLVLLCGGIGAILAFPISAWMITHFQARRTVLYSGIGVLLWLVGMAAASRIELLMAALIGFGVCASTFDVAINLVGARVEQIAQRSIMSMMHAWYCVGTFGGALMGSAMAALSIAPLPHFSIVASLLVLPLWFAYGALPEDEINSGARKKIFAMPHGALILLGILGFCAAIAEGSVGDWSGIYMKDHFRAGEAVAPLAYAAFAAMMLGARLTGDRLKDRFGARRVIVLGALLSAGGISISVLTSSIPLAIVGFALSGAGVAVNFPFIFSAAGKHGGTALAGVATFGYSGTLIGPPMIGLIAEVHGLQMGIAFIGLLSLAVAIAASRARALE